MRDCGLPQAAVSCIGYQIKTPSLPMVPLTTIDTPISHRSVNKGSACIGFRSFKLLNCCDIWAVFYVIKTFSPIP